MYPNSYNYYPQSQNPYLNRYMPINQYTQQLQGLKGRPVSSLEEVRATGIDFDGSVFYFPDLANRRIYTKQINLDGTASLNMYELKATPPPTAQPEATPSDASYVSKEEFEKTVTILVNEINKLKGANADESKPNDESNGDATEFKF